MKLLIAIMLFATAACALAQDPCEYNSYIDKFGLVITDKHREPSYVVGALMYETAAAAMCKATGDAPYLWRSYTIGGMRKAWETYPAKYSGKLLHLLNGFTPNGFPYSGSIRIWILPPGVPRVWIRVDKKHHHGVMLMVPDANSMEHNEQMIEAAMHAVWPI